MKPDFRVILELSDGTISQTAEIDATGMGMGERGWGG